MNWVHTIEVNKELHEFAKEGLKGNGNYQCIFGDDAKYFLR